MAVSSPSNPKDAIAVDAPLDAVRHVIEHLADLPDHQRHWALAELDVSAREVATGRRPDQLGAQWLHRHGSRSDIASRDVTSGRHESGGTIEGRSG